MSVVGATAETTSAATASAGSPAPAAVEHARPGRPPGSWRDGTISSSGWAMPAPSPDSSPPPSASTSRPTPARRRASGPDVLRAGTGRYPPGGDRGPSRRVADRRARPRPRGRRARPGHLGVERIRRAYQAAVARGAIGVRPPWTEEDESGKVTRATIAVYGDTRHTFVERSAYSGLFLPGYHRRRPPVRPVRTGRGAHSHRPRGRQRRAGRARRLGRLLPRRHGLRAARALRRRPDLHGVLGADVNRGVGRAEVVLPINEPADGRKKSQIQEYLEYYDGAPGCSTSPFAPTTSWPPVTALRERGVRFMTVPDTLLRRGSATRMAGLDLPWEQLQRASGSWSTATRTATCSRSSPRTSPIARPSSSRSSSGEGPRVSGRATSRPCSKPSSAPRPGAATSDPLRIRRIAHVGCAMLEPPWWP